ncbi:Pepd [Symbiodinium sp. CCMP2592]|nr:Pepd [Symbiodinium sp. CCMP2592]
MGCSESSTWTEEEPCGRGSVVYYAETLEKPPKDALPPDTSTHRHYVLQLHTYLISVAKNPHAFQAEVEQRRREDFGEPLRCERLRDAGLLVGEIDDMMAANVGGVLMPHGLGHFMGIDTHDVGGYPKGAQRDARDGYKALRVQRLLEPGFVLTVEPGIYFMDYALRKAKEEPERAKFFNWHRLGDFANFGGIRLEDNVLVTESGIENFTVAPRTVDEVEAVMRGEIVDAAALLTWRQEREEPQEQEEEEEEQDVYGHSATVVGGRVWVLGGKNQPGKRIAVHTFDPLALVWSDHSPADRSVAPTKRWELSQRGFQQVMNGVKKRMALQCLG